MTRIGELGAKGWNGSMVSNKITTQDKEMEWVASESSEIINDGIEHCHTIIIVQNRP